MKLLKSKVVGMTDEQYTDRYLLIKEVADRRAKIKIIDYADDEIVNTAKYDNDSEIHYTDGEKYLAEHYGDRLADQTAYESTEGWN
jgi:hypothetical protein